MQDVVGSAACDQGLPVMEAAGAQNDDVRVPAARLPRYGCRDPVGPAKGSGGSADPSPVQAPARLGQDDAETSGTSMNALL